MTSKGRSYTQPSEWDSHDDYNDSLFDAQYTDDNISGGVNLDHCRLYITNVPRGLNEEGLRAAFSKFGTLIEAYLSKDPLKKFGLVKYETPGEAKLAMMKMNKTEPLKLNINIAHKSNAKKSEERSWTTPIQERLNSSGRERNSNRDESASICSKSRTLRGQETLPTEKINGDNNMDDFLVDDCGFSEILDPSLTLELENLKLEQLKIREEQLQCKHRMIMLKQQERRPLHQNTVSNRCVLPDGKIVVRHGDRSGDLDVTHSAGAGDSSVPALLRANSRACVSCGMPADTFCARCELTPYCSARCQAKDWEKRHRSVCHNLARLSGGDAEVPTPAAELHRKIHNPAPLRRPHVFNNDVGQERSPKRDDDTASRVSDKSASFRRLQNKGKSQTQRQPFNHDKKDINTYKRDNKHRSSNHQQSNQSPNHQQSNQSQRKNVMQKFKQKSNIPESPVPANEVKPGPAKPVVTEVKVEATVETPPTPAPKTQSVKPETPVAKPGSLNDVTPIRKVVPKNYLIELLSIGDTVLLSVDAKASECKSTHGDYVCLSMHEKFEADYQVLCEDYVLACDADEEPYKLTPGEACSYFNPEDGGWYRGRCLNPTTVALLDSSKLTSVKPTDKIRKLSPAYERIPEFCCVLDNSNVEIGANLKCSIISKAGGGFKVSIENADTSTTVGEGVLSRWLPTVEYPIAKPVIPEVSRPPVLNNSRVLLVHVTSLECAFVRPADIPSQKEYDNVLQTVLLAGRKATPLKEPPVMGQTVIAKFSDGVHYRALCKRTNVSQKKYQLEYIDFGNVDICHNLEDMFPCPANLNVMAIPSHVSMIKLNSEGGKLTSPALEYVDKLKDSADEMILTLPDGEATAASGSLVTLKLVKNNENVNKKIIEMCTPDWKKFEEKGGDVIELEPLMFDGLEYQCLPSGPVVLDVLDLSVIDGGVVSGCVKGNKHADYVFKELTQKMANYCNSDLGREPYLPKIEELCIAKCPPYPQWFRAVMLGQEGGAGGSQAQLCYIDYGNVDFVPVSELRKMLPDFVRGVPVVAAHLEIKNFPKDPTPEMLRRALEHMNINEDGRGELTVQSCEKQDEGWYLVHAPDLIKAMLQ